MDTNTGRIYDFRPRPLSRPQTYKWGRGRGNIGINESYSTYEPEINVQVGQQLQRAMSCEQFEDFDGENGEFSKTQMHSGDHMTDKIPDRDNSSHQDVEIEMVDHSQHNENRNKTSGSSGKVNHTVNENMEVMFAEMRRELAETKKMLAETRVRNEEKDNELQRRGEALGQMHGEIADIRRNFQSKLDCSEQELTRVRQELSYAKSEVSKCQVGSNSETENRFYMPDVHEYNHGNIYQTHHRYDNYIREGCYDAVPQMVSQMPGPMRRNSRSLCGSYHNTDEPKFRLPYFNGKSKFEGFWTVFELGAHKFQWNEQAKIENLWCCLKDDALDFASKLSHEVQNDVLKFRDALQRRYGDNRLPEQYREDLSNVKKHHKETLPEYAARVENLVCKGYPHLRETDLLNTLKVENFLKGFPDQNIAYEVKIRKPQNIDDAIELLNWHECCKGNIFKKRADVRQIEIHGVNESLDEAEIRKLNGSGPRFVTEERLDKRLQIFSREIKNEFSVIENNLTGEISKLAASLNKNQNNKRNYSDVTCFSCHEKGHTSKYCTKKKSISGGNNKENNYNHGFNNGNENAQKGVNPETTKKN